MEDPKLDVDVLAKGDAPVNEIAYAVGFSHISRAASAASSESVPRTTVPIPSNPDGIPYGIATGSLSQHGSHRSTAAIGGRSAGDGGADEVDEERVRREDGA